MVWASGTASIRCFPPLSSWSWFPDVRLPGVLLFLCLSLLPLPDPLGCWTAGVGCSQLWFPPPSPLPRPLGIL